MADHSRESKGSCALDFKDTELTLSLGLPGGSSAGFKRALDLNLSDGASLSVKPPTAKAQLVGWPPVKPSRKSTTRDCKYVKVAVDGAPYLRKVDLVMFTTYQQLLQALEELFSSFTIRNYFNDGKLMDPVNGCEYVPTYEDKDGDWMMVGDVPWKMFVESCKRVRLMTSSEATGFVPRKPSN